MLTQLHRQAYMYPLKRGNSSKLRSYLTQSKTLNTCASQRRLFSSLPPHSHASLRSATPSAYDIIRPSVCRPSSCYPRRMSVSSVLTPCLSPRFCSCMCNPAYCSAFGCNASVLNSSLSFQVLMIWYIAIIIPGRSPFPDNSCLHTHLPACHLHVAYEV